jgi:hypothetical protein
VTLFEIPHVVRVYTGDDGVLNIDTDLPLNPRSQGYDAERFHGLFDDIRAFMSRAHVRTVQLHSAH